MCLCGASEFQPYKLYVHLILEHFFHVLSVVVVVVVDFVGGGVVHITVSYRQCVQSSKQFTMSAESQ